jgi:hypothetical protein
MATVTNVLDQPCRQNFPPALSEIQSEEGEEPERTQRLIENVDPVGSVFDYGPRPFSVISQSGTDYSFFVENKGEGYLLHLYGWQRASPAIPTTQPISIRPSPLAWSNHQINPSDLARCFFS